MIDRGTIGLICESPDHDRRNVRPALTEYGFRSYELLQLRKKASELGWVSVPLPGAPWRVQDFCPDHLPEGTAQ